MPVFQKGDKKAYHMNPQAGKAMHSAPPAPLVQEDAGEGTDQSSVHHVAVYKGGNPEGEPPMHEGHQYHTVEFDEGDNPVSVTNHDDYSSMEQQLKQCMGESQDQPLSDEGGDE